MSTRFNVRLPDDVDERMPYEEHDSKSATVAHYAEKGLDADERIDELRDELDGRDAKIADLRRQLANANQRIDAANELVEYVESERTLSERKARAGALTRVKWWLTGMPREEEG